MPVSTLAGPAGFTANCSAGRASRAGAAAGRGAAGRAWITVACPDVPVPRSRRITQLRLLSGVSGGIGITVGSPLPFGDLTVSGWLRRCGGTWLVACGLRPGCDRALLRADRPDDVRALSPGRGPRGRS